MSVSPDPVILEVDLMVNLALVRPSVPKHMGVKLDLRRGRRRVLSSPAQIGHGSVHESFCLSCADAMMVAAIHGEDVTAPPLVRVLFQPFWRAVWLKIGLDLGRFADHSP